MRTFLFGLLLSVAAVMFTGSAAGAGPPAIATGTWDCTRTVRTNHSIRTADGNIISTFSATGCVYAGDLTGTFSLHLTRVVKSDGSFIDHGYIVCTGCTIGGRTGDFTAALTARSPSPGEVYGVITVVSATGGLTGLHAVNHFERHAPALGTYSYLYSFQP
jgi:hypothetical protein